METPAHRNNRRRQVLPPGGAVGLSSNTAPLSPRQAEVLELAAVSGLTAEQTAERLRIATRTVVGHLQDAMAKLGAINKTHLVSLAFARGILIVKQAGHASVYLLVVLCFSSSLFVALIGYLMLPQDVTDDYSMVLRVRRNRRGRDEWWN